jgi:predicted peroxiredoxin
MRRATSRDYSPLFIVIDEVQTFLDYTSAYGKSAELLSDITRQCIQVGIKLIVSTQQAEIGLMGKSLNNLRLRACHKVDKGSPYASA